MHHADTDEHSPSLALARNDLGSVSMCPCGVLTLTLHSLSLRFDPAAFRELLGLLGHAQRRLEGESSRSVHPQALPIDPPPIH